MEAEVRIFAIKTYNVQPILCLFWPIRWQYSRIYRIVQNFCRSLISWIFNRWQNISMKIFDMQHSFHVQTTTALTDNILGISCRICKRETPRRYLWSRHCFADSSKLKWMSVTIWCILDKLAICFCIASCNSFWKLNFAVHSSYFWFSSASCLFLLYCSFLLFAMLAL